MESNLTYINCSNDTFSIRILDENVTQNEDNITDLERDIRLENKNSGHDKDLDDEQSDLSSVGEAIDSIINFTVTASTKK